MFLCFNDDLLEQLVKCHVGFKKFNMNVCCPTVADYMVLMALSIARLAILLCICYAYSCKWRYDYSAPKSSVIVYNETKKNYQKSNRVWYLGNSIMAESKNYKHLGVNNNNDYITYIWTYFDWSSCLSTRVHKTTYHMGCWFFPFNISN